MINVRSLPKTCNEGGLGFTSQELAHSYFEFAGTMLSILVATRKDNHLLLGSSLQRNCFSLIWLNPLPGAPDYEPLMADSDGVAKYGSRFAGA